MQHLVHLYQETRFLAEAVAEYLGESLRAGEAAIVIARPAHRAAFLERLNASGAVHEGRLQLLDAQETLGRLMADGVPQWQQGRRDAALRLEGYWNELGKEHAFSLFCAYRMDALDSDAYVGPLDSVCNAHSHFLPARHQDRFDEAVHAATFKVPDQRLAQMLLALAASHRPGTRMPVGQATLSWLQHNMPRTAEKVFRELRAGPSPAA
jgi:hypothetical protein